MCSVRDVTSEFLNVFGLLALVTIVFCVECLVMAVVVKCVFLFLKALLK